MQEPHPKTHNEIIQEFGEVQTDIITQGGIDDEWLKASLRALLLHVGEEVEKLYADQIPELEGADGDDCRVRNGTVDDCKRVIEKIQESI